MKIDLNINLPGISENEYKVVDYRIPQVGEYFYFPGMKCALNCATYFKNEPYLILQKIALPEVTTAIWHTMDRLQHLDCVVKYVLLLRRKDANFSEIETIQFDRQKCTNFDYWTDNFKEFAVIGKY